MRIVSSSCSTTTTVLPRSRSRDSVVKQATIVALVQADRRLVEHVEHAGEVGADLRRQPNALSFTAGQRGRAAIERQISNADVIEESQPLANLPQHAPGHERFALAQLEGFEHRQRVADWNVRRTRRCRGP